MRNTQKGEVALERAVVKMALAAEQIGLTPDDLISLLDSGMSVEQLMEYVMATQPGHAIEN